MVNIGDSDNPSEKQQKKPQHFFFSLDYMRVFFGQTSMLLDQAAGYQAFSEKDNHISCYLALFSLCSSKR